MTCIIYVNNNGSVPVYQQYNEIANYAKRNGYTVSGKVLDLNGKNFHTAINKTIADKSITTLLIYEKDIFADFEEYLFYKIFFEHLGKTMLICN